jgi:mannose-6-phosphate isomerase-like protein (cupin superfamily)
LKIQAYIESGILEMYALDLLDLNEREEVERMVAVFPTVKKELDSILHALEMYAISQGMKPAPHVKEKIIQTINNLEKEQEMDPRNLPLINAHSNYSNWLEFIKDIPVKPEDGRFIKVLQNSPTVVQMLLVSETDFEDEVHEDVYESFLILKGRAKCVIGEDVNYMEAGDFMNIPLHVSHTVEILSGSVTAILQRIAVSA